MRLTMLSSAITWLVLSTSAFACSVIVPTPATNQMAILQPCSSSLVVANWVTSPRVSYIAIADQDMMIAPSTKTPISVQAPGMGNVEVWVHGKFASRLVSDGVGGFSGVLDTSREPIGPLPIGIFAWDGATPGGAYTIALVSMMDLYVNSGTWLAKPQPAGAKGMTLKWAEYWHKQDFTACKPGTGVWPSCAHPTAADGFTWYENKPGGGDFGDAAFEHTDSVAYNPYHIIPGYLRIRSTYDPAYVDPYGYKRHWRSGLLATAFPDGSSNIPTLGNGYYEARILLPSGSGTSWNTGWSGGTWPGWWMLDRDAITNGAIGNIEYDIGEWYGVDMRVWHIGVHSYAPATGPNAGIFTGSPTTPAGTDLSWDFHRYGLLITDTTVTAYFDDVPKGSLPKSMFPGGKPLNMFMMVNLAMGSGWPDHAPPAGYYDMWIKYVWYWAP